MFSDSLTIQLTYLRQTTIFLNPYPMNSTISFSGKFTLDKAHYTECYTQSSTVEHTTKTYLKANILTVFGLFILLFTPINAYAAWFVIALGILETLSIYYHQPWWVLRQMFSKSAHSEVTITVDEQGVLTESFHVNGRILWSEVIELKETELGFVLVFSIGKGKTAKSYLSKSCLCVEAQHFVLSRGTIKPSTH